MTMSLRLRDIGLALSGGGAKGAYQIGAFCAMKDAGVINRVTHVSGTSIGAYNAIAFANLDKEIWNDAWSNFNQHKQSPEGEQPSNESLGIKVMEMCRADHVLHGNIKLYVCAYNICKEEPEYFCLNDFCPEEAAILCRASCNYPKVYKTSIDFRGQKYFDGGVVPDGINKNNADKIPVAPLKDSGCGIIIVMYLNVDEHIDLGGFPEGTKVLELHPSKPLEKYFGEGTLDFAKESLDMRQQLGYDDAKMFIEKYLQD